MLADAYFVKKGIRKNVNIKYVTPLSGAFTKPLASEMLGGLLKKKNIDVIPDFNLAEVNNDTKTLVDFAGQEVPFDLLVTIPLHSGDSVISKSGLGDDFGFVPTDKHTLKSIKHNNIFAIGDATNIPASKAGSVVHFQAEILFKNIMAFIDGKEMIASFDGHANCFIETGFNKGTIIDFNFETEPLPGTYPLPMLGPFSLLKESWFNHLGKLFFKWMYWHILLPDRPLPLPSHMSMVGKKKTK
jgi:sulfide:quinone oxidoreductase